MEASSAEGAPAAQAATAPHHSDKKPIEHGCGFQVRLELPRRAVLQYGRAWRTITTVLCGLLVTGCPSVNPVPLGPINIVRPFVSVAHGSILSNGRYIYGGTLDLRVLDSASHLRIANIDVSILGTTLATSRTGSTYDLEFSPLASGSYRVHLAGAGYVSKTVSPIWLSNNATSTLEVNLSPSAGPVSGEIRDSDTAKPIGGARIYSGESVTFSAPNGTFTLDGLPAGVQDISVRKTGYRPLSLQGSGGQNLGTTSLTPIAIVIDIANSSSIQGQGQASALIAGLEGALRQAGATVQESDANGANVIVVAGPGTAVSDQASAYEQFVSSGGKLVVMGEWGGAGGGYNPDSANALLVPLGLAVETDLVRSSSYQNRPEWILATPDYALGSAASQVELLYSASIFSIPPAASLLSAGSAGYRIAAVGANGPVLAAAMPHNDGLAVAIGDCSAFLDSNTTGQGSNLGLAGNRAFIVDSLLW